MDHTEAHPTISSPVIDSPIEKIGKKSLVIRIILNFFIFLTCYLVFFILKKKGFIYDDKLYKIPPDNDSWLGFGQFALRKVQD